MCHLFHYRPTPIFGVTFPDLAFLIDSIESVLATTITEDLKKADNDGNLLNPDSYANCIHIPTLDEGIAPEVSIQLNCMCFCQ